jgi:hypothetical protein
MNMHRQFPVGLLTGLGITLTALAQAPSQFELQAPPAIFGLTLSRALAADVDGDGDLDVVGLGPLALVRNDGPAGFTDVTAQQMLPGSSGDPATRNPDGNGRRIP